MVPEVSDAALVTAQTVGKKPSKARVKKKGDEGCWSCRQPIRPGEHYVRRSKGSRRPLHLSCRDELLRQREEAV